MNPRTRDLEALRVQIWSAIENPSRESFVAAFAKAQTVLGLSDNDIAKTIQISRPTVGRWARGESAPHPVGRGPVLQWLLGLVEQASLRSIDPTDGVTLLSVVGQILQCEKVADCKYKQRCQDSFGGVCPACK